MKEGWGRGGVSASVTLPLPDRVSVPGPTSEDRSSQEPPRVQRGHYSGPDSPRGLSKTAHSLASRLNALCLARAAASGGDQAGD